ncbi:hypothetical protein E4U13_003290 [Claviceps humidiphila]|uniref:Uncharacterized protein n=1 Tax=Claviceps humidiphila TaxID=1294629 RepID=A0A9P7Q0G5_9HYPO|nr:hypothetical protein E4U13_003290 [Claviceps humidiphila]
MEEVYSAITTWAANVNNVYQRNSDTIRDCYQRVCVFYQEVVDTIRIDGTIEPENNTRLFTAMEEVAPLFLGDLYGQIIQFADDADQQRRALTRLLDVHWSRHEVPLPHKCYDTNCPIQNSRPHRASRLPRPNRQVRRVDKHRTVIV